MKYLSICSGIEAASVAWEPLGWECVGVSEIEAFPSALLKTRYPHVPNLGDMTKFRDWPEAILAEVDLIVGGCPCQAFSVAGLRNSLDDDRGNLTLTYVHLINHIDTIRIKNGKPRIIVVYENVPGILNTKDNAFGHLIGALCGQTGAIETEAGKWPKASILWGEERRVGYRTLDAQYFAVAQRRRRIFVLAVPNELIADFGEQFCPSEILSIGESLCGDIAPSRSTWKKATGKTTSGTGSGGLSAGVEVSTYDYQSNCEFGIGEVSHTLAARDYKAATNLVTYAIQGSMIGRSDTAGLQGDGINEEICFTQNITDRHAVSFTQNTRDEVRYIGGDGQIAGALAASSGMKQTNYIMIDSPDHHGVAHSTAALNPNVVGTLASSGGGMDRPAGQGNEADFCVTTPTMQVRRLTPIECARLQGFPDDYLDITFNGKPATDTVKYKALGNSMAVPVMAWIGLKIAIASLL